MEDYYRKTIDDAEGKLRSLEQDVIKHKKFINSLYEMAGEQPRYSDDLKYRHLNSSEEIEEMLDECGLSDEKTEYSQETDRT